MANLSVTIEDTSTPQSDAYSYINVRSTPVKSRDTLSRQSMATIDTADGVRVVEIGAVRYDTGADGFLVEPERTNYLIQPYAISGSYVAPSAPSLSQTITLPSTGPYTLSVVGAITATIEPGTAQGQIYGTAVDIDPIPPFRADVGRADVDMVGGYGYCMINVTTPGTVIVTISGYVEGSGDYCQLEYGKYPSSYIPNTSATGTTRKADRIVIPLREMADLFTA